MPGPRPAKPSIDNMGPGTDRETPVPPHRPHAPSLKETHGQDFTPLTGERPKPRSIGGRAGSDLGKKGRRR